MEFSLDLGGKTIRFQVGELAQMAGGSVLVTLGETVVLSCVCGSRKPKENANFLPLSVDYRERVYAMGKIPGGFFRREGRPRETEILASRITDRSLRPLFPEGFSHEVAVQNVVLSSDGENDADILSMVGASLALTISDVPFNGPVAGLRVAHVGNAYVLNPTFAEIATSDMDLVVSATADGIVMVEGIAQIVSEEVFIEAIRYALPYLNRLCDLQKEIALKVGKPKFPFTPLAWDPALKTSLETAAAQKMKSLLHARLDKTTLDLEIEKLVAELTLSHTEKFPELLKQIPGVVHDYFYAQARLMILEEKTRVDGRKLNEIRPLSARVGVLPRTHGSAVFQRGSTQALATATLGTAKDMQQMEELEGEYMERFLLHYNFPGFSTGEVKMDRGPGRREVGHGFLARKALLSVLPKEEDFPYTIRVVSDILSSNGSTSMASVCGGSLALFDAGVPMADHVAGIAMGLISEGKKHAVLTDIMGLEDHLGDMDFKVAGTRSGVSAVQMDLKVPGVSFEVLTEALEQARLARLSILEVMTQTMPSPRASLSTYAPKLVVVSIDITKIGSLIGPGGKNIRKISETTGAEIEVEDDGRVFIHGNDWESVERAKAMVEGLTKDPEVGKTYKGRVVSIMDFGAFVEIMPGRDGLLHVSQISDQHVGHPSDVLKEGEEIEVKVLDIDNDGKIRLSRKALLSPGSENTQDQGGFRRPHPGGSGGPHRGPRPDGGPRDRPRGRF